MGCVLAIACHCYFNGHNIVLWEHYEEKADNLVGSNRQAYEATGELAHLLFDLRLIMYSFRGVGDIQFAANQDGCI